MKTLSKKSYSKVNLFLKILSKKDGFHNLETALAFVDLYDSIEVFQSQKFHLEISGNFSGKIDKENNIFTEILQYFVKNFNISKNLSIKLEKNIPVGAGLGGGSSNGAEFIKIINEIFKLNLSKEKMQEISFNFGSDIALFFEDKASIIKGRGNVVCDIKNFEPIDILLINPNIFLSTKKVFENFKDDFSQEILNKILESKNINEMLEMPNQLENSAIEIVKEISIILENLKNNGAKIAKMSGSGATCFGIFEDKKSLENSYLKMKKDFPNFFIIKTKILQNV